MDKKFDELNKTFNLERDSVDIVHKEVDSVVEKVEKISSDFEDIRKDYDYTRGNLYSLIEKGQEAINGILELAQESEMPRAYEVAGQLIKSVADATDKLMDLQKKLKDIEDQNNSKSPTTVNNALFVGSTSDLAKLLKNQLNQDQ